MIRLVNSDWERELNFDGSIIRLYIESEQYFRKTILQLKRQTELNEEGKFVLSEDEKTLDLSKKVWVVSDFTSLDPNERKVVTKLIQELCEKSQVDFHKYQEFLNQLNNFYNDLLFEFDMELVRENDFNVKDVIKLGGFTFEYNLESIEDMLINYMTIIRKYLNIDLFILINMEKYFSKEELNIVLDNFKQKGFNVLLIESGNYSKIDYKQVENYIIDVDLCEL